MGREQQRLLSRAKTKSAAQPILDVRSSSESNDDPGVLGRSLTKPLELIYSLLPEQRVVVGARPDHSMREGHDTHIK